MKEANQSFDWLFSNIFTHLKVFSDHILILIEYIFFTKKIYIPKNNRITKIYKENALK